MRKHPSMFQHYKVPYSVSLFRVLIGVCYTYMYWKMLKKSFSVHVIIGEHVVAYVPLAMTIFEILSWRLNSWIA